MSVVRCRWVRLGDHSGDSGCRRKVGRGRSPFDDSSAKPLGVLRNEPGRIALNSLARFGDRAPHRAANAPRGSAGTSPSRIEEAQQELRPPRNHERPLGCSDARNFRHIKQNWRKPSDHDQRGGLYRIFHRHALTRTPASCCGDSKGSDYSTDTLKSLPRKAVSQ